MTEYIQQPEGCKGDNRLIAAAFGFAATASALRHARDVVDEVVDRAFPISPHTRQRLLAQGVAEPHFRSLSAAHVVLVGDGRFEWSASVTDDASAVRALIGLCHDVGNSVCDCWAWAGGDTQVCTLWGRSSGVNSAREALRWRIPEPLTVHRSPVGWLAGGCNGVFVVDWMRAPHLLCDCGPLLARDVAHGEEIEHHFAKAGLVAPSIVVPRPVEVAAA